MAARKTDLAALAHDPGFTPGRRDVAPLLEQLAAEDDELVEATERALVRVGPTVVEPAIRRAREAAAPLRGRICRVIGRFSDAPEARAFLLAALTDADAKTRRNAAIALGKVASPAPDVEAALVAAYHDGASVPLQRSIATALGKVGGDAARELLRGVRTDDAELKKAVERALLVLERTSMREEATTLASDVTPAVPMPLVFRCRAGIERILEDELGTPWSARVAGEGVVHAMLRGPLGRVLDARTWTRVAFRIAPRRVEGGDVAAALVDALTSDEVDRVVRAFTKGAARYRIAWETRGPSRALVWRSAQAIRELRPALVNDPRQSAWEAHVYESHDALTVELEPRALVDTRFAYRTGDVPAASHPTLAAALARAAGAREGDVVWDPFVGSGTELVERARLGKYASLHGTDVSDEALAVARANLAAAGVHAELTRADATTSAPPGVTLVITNPPMGRRLSRGSLPELMDAFVDNVARALVPGGRLVWFSPLGARTRERLAACGLTVSLAQAVDLGGYRAELQSASKQG